MKVNSDSLVLSPGIRQGIEMLLLAHAYAREVQRDSWEFALEIQCLWEAGVNNNELRWLVCKGLACHAEEETGRTNSQRAFRNVGNLTFSERSCFVLTNEGFEAFKRLSPRRMTSLSSID